MLSAEHTMGGNGVRFQSDPRGDELLLAYHARHLLHHTQGYQCPGGCEGIITIVRGRGVLLLLQSMYGWCFEVDFRSHAPANLPYRLSSCLGGDGAILTTRFPTWFYLLGFAS